MIVHEICRAINRNPMINRVTVCAREYEQIRKELEEMSFVRPQERPTYGGPFGHIDRLLWDFLQEEKKLARIEILGRPVFIHR